MSGGRTENIYDPFVGNLDNKTSVFVFAVDAT